MKVVIEPALVVTADVRTIHIVLQNLLSNAWKFSSKKDHARIEFARCQTNDETTYFVRDNGAGFDMTYADNLFGPFQRLHSTDEFEGNGIGPATVQQVINRHGGAYGQKV